MDLFWFIVCTLAILWIYAQIMRIWEKDWSQQRDRIIKRNKKKDEE